MNQVKDFLEYVFNAFKIWVIVQPWELGLIVRAGKNIRKVNKGIYFKIPYIDSVYVQEVRLRVRELAIQTLTSKDNKTITMNSSIGYIIDDIQKLYDSLYAPEQTISNMAMSEMAQIVSKTNVIELTQEFIEKSVLDKLNSTDYGLKFEYFKITNFAIVRTYRLIQDQSWVDEGYKLNEKK